MAATALCGYDPTTLAWKEISTPVPENCARPTDIVDEGLFAVVALRKRRHNLKLRRAWLPIRPRPRTFHPRRHPVYRGGIPLCPAFAAEDFTIVLKPPVMVDLIDIFNQVN
ncbi:hypothetical protein MRX96_051231 [Rhipicephalus microplus]